MKKEFNANLELHAYAIQNQAIIGRNALTKRPSVAPVKNRYLFGFLPLKGKKV